MIGKTGTARRAKASRTRRGSRRSPTRTNDPALPQYVVVAMVEQGGFGADVAAPIVRRVIDFLNGNPMATRPRRHRAADTRTGQKQD